MLGDILNSAKNILGYTKKIIELKSQIGNPDKNSLNKLLDGILAENHKIFSLLNIHNEDAKPRAIKPAPAPSNKKPESPNIPLQKNISPLPKPDFGDRIIPEHAKAEEQIQGISSDVFKRLSDKDKKQFVKELDISYSDLKKFIKNYNKRDSKEIKKTDYTVYKPSSLGEFANKHMKKYADNLISKYPEFFKPMFGNFLTVEMELLSRSYVSMMLLFTVLAFPASLLFLFVLNPAFKLNIVTIFILSILCTILTFIGFYFYPASLIGQKSKNIKLELPFALVHMSAVAGSGAQPLSIFELIAESEEYPEMKKEIKKVLNYVNLFGYNLSNALRNVANTTASPEFKELLNGMISTIETGGDLKGYLKEKSDDALNTYKLDRKKQVEALATYSEVYTSILIAAPLLLLVTLAIINSIGGKLGGLDVKL